MFGDTFKKLCVRYLFISAVLAAFVCLVNTDLFAAWGEKPARKAAPAAVQPVAAQAPAVEASPAKAAPVPAAIQQKQPTAQDMEKRRNMIKAAKEKLNNTVLEIELSQMTAEPKKETFKDTLRFSDNKIESDKLKAEGFPATNYTVSMSGEDIVVWETMQTSEKKGLAFWKGELENGVMRGVLSRHLDEKTVKDYSFASTKVEAVEAPKEEAIPESAAAVEAPKVETKTEPAAAEVKQKMKPAVEPEKKKVEVKQEAPKAQETVKNSAPEKKKKKNFFF